MEGWRDGGILLLEVRAGGCACVLVGLIGTETWTANRVVFVMTSDLQ